MLAIKHKSCNKERQAYALFRYLIMTIIIGIILSLLALSMVYKRKGRWYDYLAVVILSAIATIALMLVQ